MKNEPPRPVHHVCDTRNRLPLGLRTFVDFAVLRMRERLVHAAIQAIEAGTR
jgi:hypothetical protein